jgi:predicted phosphodiesterase
MRILVISDIHANLTALEAVLSAAREYDITWCLGDLVGYGPDPNQCIERVRELPGLVGILGNHDAAALGRLDASTFNYEARQALYWTQKVLTESSHAFLSNLVEKVVIDSVTLCHGSPRFPVWEYLLDNFTATQNFEHFDTPYCFVGHTHLPVQFTYENGQHMARLNIPEANQVYSLTNKTIINPGSVGQPRDHDPRAAFALFDTQSNSWDYRRVPYDIAAVQERMLLASLPERHIRRLEAGW